VNIVVIEFFGLYFPSFFLNFGRFRGDPPTPTQFFPQPVPFPYDWFVTLPGVLALVSPPFPSDLRPHVLAKALDSLPIPPWVQPPLFEKGWNSFG